MIQASSFRILPTVTNVTVVNLPLSHCGYIRKLTVWALHMLTALSINRPKIGLFRQSSELRQGQPFYRFGSIGRLLVLFVGILLLGMVGFYFFQPHVAIPSTMTPSQTIPTAIQPSATIIPPTNSPAPTSTFVSTPSSAPQLHLLEIPVTGGERKFLVHLVRRGETFETIAAAYNTTPEVIRSLNYSMKLSLWANSVIVISPGFKQSWIPPCLLFKHIRFWRERPTSTSWPKN